MEEKEICDMYKNGKYIKEISKELNISYRKVREILVENNIEILNISKRVAPKNAFKKNHIPHNYKKTAEESYGKKAAEIKQKISDARLGKKYIDIFGSEEKIVQFKEKCKTTREKNREKNFKMHSIATTRKWENGVYNNSYQNFKRTKWYDYVRKDGSIVRLQGTWELELAKRLDFLNIKWICHSEIINRFIFYDKDNVRHSYRPDFQIINTNVYLDPHWDFSDNHVWKFNYVKNNYDVDLILLKNIEEIKSFKAGGK